MVNHTHPAVLFHTPYPEWVKPCPLYGLLFVEILFFYFDVPKFGIIFQIGKFRLNYFLLARCNHLSVWLFRHAWAVIFPKSCPRATIATRLINRSGGFRSCASGLFLWLPVNGLFYDGASLVVVRFPDLNIGVPQGSDIAADLLGREQLVDCCEGAEEELCCVVALFPQGCFSELHLVDVFFHETVI